ncbi:MAG: bifunctional 5,10-methylene-tetrahydrofolate dehydrogenase/5,10-methylene-tetrahydrofolate cyclohydrolase [Verrucomicrobia bacterium]|nr:MAG: bifunctional 5,10-methylene-tetrahydrofolate dehydrogenase/5,10-methylene-tetrahydrofolate cyclohydrolase [Verrucomicrobiota bacterium]
MKLIDGKTVAEKIHEQTHASVQMLAKRGHRPGLAVILVGDNPASRTYVRKKAEQCAKLGFHSVKLELPENTSQGELLAHVATFNQDPEIHGILVQSPLPTHINEAKIVHAISPEKDVDGFHPINVAKLALEDPSGFIPCTPLGCRCLLLEYGVPISGANVVVLGRSMIVGKSLALLLMQRGSGGDATVTVAHSRTLHLETITRAADIVITAIGSPHFLQAKHVRDGAVVIDVGINRVEDASQKNGYRLVGDVDFENVAPKCSLITPVPGGVGPMTIAMLLSNTIKACCQIHGVQVLHST